MPTKTKVTAPTQDTILAAAAARRYGHVLPLPNDADAASPKTAKLLKSMLAAGLVEEHSTRNAKNAWRLNDQGKHTLLRITQAGRQATCTVIETEAAQPPSTPPTRMLALAGEQAADQARVPGGKLGQVLAAVRTGEGASLGDLVALTGWQPHTIRASLTRLRQSGVPIQLTQGDLGKRYFAGADGAPAQ